MNRRHAILSISLLTTLSAGLSLWSAEGVAERATRPVTFEAIPMRPGDLLTLERTLRTPSVMELANLSIKSASRRALNVAVSQSTHQALALANDDLSQARYDSAEGLLRVLLDRLQGQPQDDETKVATAQTSMLLARVLLASNQPQEALSALMHTDAQTPIEDYRRWMQAQAYTQLGAHEKAAQAYAQVAQLEQSPLAHRATVNRAHALFLAKDYAAAIPALTQVHELYPDYPRRYVALLQLAQAQEATGKLDQAAKTYQQVWFEYPFRREGQRAQDKLKSLSASGHVAPELSAQDKFTRYRWLRINKHWDTARQLFLELAQQVRPKSDAEDASLYHEVLMQLGLNAYIPKAYPEALGYFEQLVKAYEADQRQGIDAELTYTYYARTLAKVGRFDEALKALDKAIAREPKNTQDTKRAEFLTEHGRYKEALALLTPITAPYAQKAWSYTWLLYKSAKFKEARENLLALAQRSSGSTKAKYQYWAARAAEREGLRREAEALFKDVLNTSSTSYYAIQANNRLIDLKRRQTLNNQLLVNTVQVERAAEVAIDALNEQGAKASSPAALIPQAPPRHTPRDPDRPSYALSTLLEPTACDLEQPSESLLCEIAYAQGAPLRQPRSLQDLAQDQPQGDEAQAALSLDDALPGPQPEAAPLNPDEPLPRATYSAKDNQRYRQPFTTDARIYWRGPDESTLEFARYEQGKAPGQKPKTVQAYDEDTYLGGIDRAADKYAELFPELERARWLKHIGLNKQARWAIREVSLEYRALYKLPTPRSAPHQLPYKRMTPLIDNRRTQKATWGYQERELRWPIPADAKARAAMLKRQQTIITKKRDMVSDLIDALKDVGDYYMVRRLTLELKPPTGSSRNRLMQLYPRAFPELVTRAAERYGVNPYLLWALMTVESSYNPDSVSVAEALGLLQVIPRTGLKIAELLGDDRFGHYDLLDEDVAVEHGAFYIAQVIRKFYGQELFSFAGYNGGPHRVAEWLDQRGDMPLDEFVEEIPYDQAREYTKKVTYFLALYLRLYEGKDTLYIGQNIQREYRRMPNF